MLYCNRLCVSEVSPLSPRRGAFSVCGWRSRGQPKRGGPSAWGWVGAHNSPPQKTVCFEMLHRASDLNEMEQACSAHEGDENTYIILV
jgi:hypothetical protein